jgi:hypothetical protein
LCDVLRCGGPGCVVVRLWFIASTLHQHLQAYATCAALACQCLSLGPVRG